ncbi:MAG: hypothetical protein K2H86_03860 [Muribaculaceae bacterium]|nr:hypothetical protein [Muribaculaceae bacterium]
MSTTEKTPIVLEESPQVEVPKVKGMSIDEIRYRRALAALKKEFCKSKVLLHKEKIANSSPFSKGYKASENNKMGRFGSIVGKLTGKLNYVDYAMMGVSLFQIGKKVFNLVRKLR